MNNALIVSCSSKGTESLKMLLKAAGYMRVAEVSSGSEARRLCTLHSFGLIVIDTPLPDEYGHELSLTLSESASADILLLTCNDIADSISDKVSYCGVCVVPKPLNKEAFLRSLNNLKATRRRMAGPKKENVRLLDRIDEMRIINRAKCTLMQYLGFTEPQAHKYIEKQAMNSRRTRRDVARHILDKYEK